MPPWVNVARDWIGSLVPLANLFLILVAANRVLRKAQQDYEERGRRIESLESRCLILENESRQLIGIAAKIEDMREETKRLRTRLDMFLDSKVRHEDGGA